MGQVSSQGVNVVNAAGSPEQNIATTGANQRAKAELAVREHELKLEQAKIKLQKFGIEEQTRNYAALNKSHETISANELAAQQAHLQQSQSFQASQSDLARQHDLATQQKQNEFLKSQDQRHLKLDILDRQTKLSGLKASLAGIEQTRADIESHKPDWVENQTMLQGAHAAEAASEQALPQVVQQFSNQMGPMIEQASREYSFGSESAKTSSTDFWRGTQDPDFFSGPPQYAPSDMPFRDNTVRAPMNTRQAAEKTLTTLAQNVAPKITNSGADVNHVKGLLSLIVQNHARKMASMEPSLSGEQFEPPSEYDKQIQGAMGELAGMKTPDGKPAVQMYGLTAWLDNLKQWGKANTVTEQMTSDQIEANQGLLEALGVTSSELPHFRTLWADPVQRKNLITSMKYTAGLSDSVDHAAGLAIRHRPLDLHTFVEAFTTGLKMYHGEAEVNAELERNGFHLDRVQQQVLHSVMSGQTAETFNKGGEAKAKISKYGPRVATDQYDAYLTDLAGQITSKRGQTSAEEQGLKEALGYLDNN